MAELTHVLCADPPWHAKDQLPGPGRGAAKNYRTMPFAKIESFLADEGLAPLIHHDAWLFMWRVSWAQEEALRVVRAWGFVPKSEIVWIKLRRSGKRHFGMGRYVRIGHETCIIAARGKALQLRRSASIPSVFDAPMPVDADDKIIHSAKPERFREIVEELVCGPYLELFARTRRVGWTVMGDDVDGRMPEKGRK